MTTVLFSPADSNRELMKTLETTEASYLTWPPLDIDTPPDARQIVEAIENLFGYDWLILKNPRAAEYFMRCFLKQHRHHELDELHVLVIGSETTDKACELQIHVDVALEGFAADEVYGEIQAYVGNTELARLNVLVPNAGVSRELFEERLEADGARVDSLIAYRTCINKDQLTKLKALIAGGGIDCVTFTNPSAVNEFACLLDTDDLLPLLTGVTVVCADPSTARAANEFGLTQTVTPSEPSLHQLAALINSLRN